MTEEQKKELAQIFEAMGNAKGNFVIGQVVGSQTNYFGGRQKEQAQTKQTDEVGQDAAQENPVNPPEDPADPVKAFVDTVKLIMKNAEKDNGKEKPIKARGNGGTYVYNVEGTLFGIVMDKIFESHKDSIADYLDGANAKKAVSMKYVCPFLGAILDGHLFTPPQMEKNSLEDALNCVFGSGSSASTKLSAKNLSESGKYLVELIKVELKNLKPNPKKASR